jgi:hypothetical protein
MQSAAANDCGSPFAIAGEPLKLLQFHSRLVLSR